MHGNPAWGYFPETAKSFPTVYQVKKSKVARLTRLPGLSASPGLSTSRGLTRAPQFSPSGLLRCLALSSPRLLSHSLDAHEASVLESALAPRSGHGAMPPHSLIHASPWGPDPRPGQMLRKCSRSRWVTM